MAENSSKKKKKKKIDLVLLFQEDAFLYVLKIINFITNYTTI